MSMITLDRDNLKKLIGGKFKVFKCVECYGDGWYWVFGDGTKRNPELHEDHDDFYRHECDECEGLGFDIVYDED